MRYVNTREGDAANLGQDRSGERDEAVIPCPFCGADQAVSMKLDEGVWAVCCGGCGTIGPHGRTVQLAEARWNSPVLRQGLP